MNEVLIVLGWGMGLGGLWLVGRWLWGDRSRGRRRCRGCWYDLDAAGEVPVRCPECGREHASERALLGTRRRWRWVAIGLVLTLGGLVVGLTPAYRAGNVYRLAPSWLLAELVPLYPPFHSMGFPVRNHPGYELVKRLIASEEQTGIVPMSDAARPMSHAEIAGVMRRLAEGNWYAPAGSRRWSSANGEWLRGQLFRFRKRGHQGAFIYPDGTAADTALSDAIGQLDRVMPRWYPRTRAAWPVGMPVTIDDGSVRPRWVSFLDGPWLEASWKVRGTDLSGTGVRIPAVGESGDEVVLDLTLRWYRSHSQGRAPETEPLREDDFVVRWRVSEQLEDVVGVVDSIVIRDAMVNVFARETAWDFDRFIEGPVWLGDGMDGVGFGVRNEVFDGEELLGSWYFWWLAKDGEWAHQSQGNAEFVDFDGFSDRVEKAMEAGTLRVRISGLADEAMTMLDADKVWVGTVEVELSGAMEAREVLKPAEAKD